jgi:hypothetical protein
MEAVKDVKYKRESKVNGQEEYWLKCLKDPMLLRRLVLDGLDEQIVGEDNARKVIFLCAMGSLVENCSKTSYNLMVNSESGAGKDHITKNVLKIFGQRVLKRTRISPAALTYWHNSKYEPNWTWDGRVLYLEDCSNEILNCDVFKVFTSGETTSTIVKDQMAIDIEIKGKPVVIITSASANPEPELVRRFIVVNLDESKEQTKDVMKKWSDHAVRGSIPKVDNAYIPALKLIKERKVKVKWADCLLKHFPSDHIIMRTHFGRFLDFVKASTVLHQYARESDIEGFIYANEQDYSIAKDVFLATASNDQMIPLTKKQREILDIMKSCQSKKLNDEEWTHQELSSKLPLSSSDVYRQVNNLVKMGFIEKGTQSSDYETKPHMIYKLKEFNKLYLPTWEEMMIL